MSKELKQFYRDLQAWIDAGMPKSSLFYPDRAICSTLLDWALAKKVEDADLPFRVGELVEEGRHLFTLNWLFGSFPFNQGVVDWKLERASKSFYKNPKRLAFIEEMAK